MSKYIDADRLRAECDEVRLNLEYLEDFIDSLQQEQPEMDEDALEKEIKECANSDYLPENCSFFDFACIARHFAEWQKAKMLEGAVDCIVENWNEELHPEITIPLNPEEFTAGNKVRVIIIKEDEK